MDPFRLVVALSPLAIYFIAFGLINLSRRPRLLDGPRDTLALGAALAGLMLVGPAELWMPEGLLARLGSHAWAAWLAWITFYAVLVLLAALVQLPRITIYNIRPAELRRVLGEIAPTLDPDARLIGDTLVLPRLAVQLHVDSSPMMRSVTLSAIGHHQSYEGWRILKQTLRAELARTVVKANPLGLFLALSGASIVIVLVVRSIIDPQAIAQSVTEALRL